MTLLAMLPNLRTNNLNGLGATLTVKRPWRIVEIGNMRRSPDLRIARAFSGLIESQGIPKAVRI